MRGLLVCIVLLACRTGGAPAPREVTPPPVDAARAKPLRERIAIAPMTLLVQAPHAPTVMILSSSPPYDGPSPTAKLSTNRAVAATASVLARERLAAIEEIRRIYQAALRERAAVDRARPDAEARVERISEARDKKVAPVDARREKAESKLRALLDKHAADLTIEGGVLRAQLYFELADEELEKKLRELAKAGIYEDVEPDLSKARQLVDEVFVKHPNAAQSLDARLLRALVYSADDARTGALLLIEVARDFPASRFVESAYHQAGHSLFGDPDPLAQANAIEAFRWLADRAATEEHRGVARFRLGQLHDRAREWPQAVAQLCKLVDTAKPDSIILEDALTYLGRAIGRGGVAPLRPACATRTCPCKEQVLVDASLHFRSLEDDAPLREVVDLGRMHFAQSSSASQWSCDLVEIAFRRGDDRAVRTEMARHEREFPSNPCVVAFDDDVSDAELVRRHFHGSRAVTACVEEAIEARRIRGNVTVDVELSVDELGKAETVVVKSPDPDTGDCIRAWIGRHRWHDLAKTRIVVPLVFEL